MASGRCLMNTSGASSSGTSWAMMGLFVFVTGRGARWAPPVRLCMMLRILVMPCLISCIDASRAFCRASPVSSCLLVTCLLDLWLWFWSVLLTWVTSLTKFNVYVDQESHAFSWIYQLECPTAYFFISIISVSAAPCPVCDASAFILSVVKDKETKEV